MKTEYDKMSRCDNKFMHCVAWTWTWGLAVTTTGLAFYFFRWKKAEKTFRRFIRAYIFCWLVGKISTLSLWGLPCACACAVPCVRFLPYSCLLFAKNIRRCLWHILWHIFCIFARLNDGAQEEKREWGKSLSLVRFFIAALWILWEWNGTLKMLFMGE